MTLKSKIKLAEDIAYLLDSKFGIGPFRFGLDPILGLIPGLGDFIPLIMSSYLIIVAIQHNISKPTILRMIFYTVADFLIGSVPVLGDAADFFFKASTKNLELLKSELHR
ncbi:MAG: hypothetical protein QG639_471 [Patescibacteria group bacterium]|nr:hypothetical protein [Patescibacteria group bacterium]